ncbi:hypothetical protein A9Q81_07110, partial [Gammaproteobacteria bacterium 42_54_T18]
MRLLLLPLFFITIGVIYFVFFGDMYPIPDSPEDLLITLKSFKEQAWIVAICIIVGDVILPLPSDITIFTLTAVPQFHNIDNCLFLSGSSSIGGENKSYKFLRSKRFS